MDATVKRLRTEIKARTRVHYGFSWSGVPGCHVIEATHTDMPMPLAFVWYRFVGINAIEVLQSFTIEHYRRCGLRNYLHEKLLECYPDTNLIVSTGGSKSGQAWMKANRYKHGEFGWEYRRKKRKQA